MEGAESDVKEAAEKKTAEDVAKQLAAEKEAAEKKAAEEVAKKVAAENETVVKKAAEETAKNITEKEAVEKKTVEEVAKEPASEKEATEKKVEEEAAKKAAAEKEATEKKAADDIETKVSAEKETTKTKAADDVAKEPVAEKEVVEEKIAEDLAKQAVLEMEMAEKKAAEDAAKKVAAEKEAAEKKAAEDVAKELAPETKTVEKNAMDNMVDDAAKKIAAEKDAAEKKAVEETARKGVAEKEAAEKKAAEDQARKQAMRKEGGSRHKSSAAEDEEVDQLMEGLRRATVTSIKSQRPSIMIPQIEMPIEDLEEESWASALGEGQASLFAQVPQASTVNAPAPVRKSVFVVPDEVFGDDTAVFGNDADILAMVSTSPPSADELREKAQQVDQAAERYVRILEDSGRLVAEVKSALYDADHSGRAEVLLDEVGNMIKSTANQTLPEAIKLQSSAEQWLGFRKRISPVMKQNHATLDELFHRRKQFSRSRNELSRGECDKLWGQVREREAELDHLPRIQERTMEKEIVTEKPIDNAAEGGLTLDGAHTLLKAFAVVLGPHVQRLIPRDLGRQTPEEAAAMEFLHACKDAGQKIGDSSSKGNNPNGQNGMQTAKQEPMNNSRLSLSLAHDADFEYEDLDQTPFLSPGFADEAETLVRQLGGFR